MGSLQVREWTLSASLDASIPSDLPQVPCPQCRRPLYEASLSCQACRLQLPADPLTGAAHAGVHPQSHSQPCSQ